MRTEKELLQRGFRLVKVNTDFGVKYKYVYRSYFISLYITKDDEIEIYSIPTSQESKTLALSLLGWLKEEKEKEDIFKCCICGKIVVGKGNRLSKKSKELYCNECGLDLIIPKSKIKQVNKTAESVSVK